MKCSLHVTQIMSSTFCPHPSKLPPWLFHFHSMPGSAIHWDFEQWCSEFGTSPDSKCLASANEHIHNIIGITNNHLCNKYIQTWPCLNSFLLLYSEMKTGLTQHWAHNYCSNKKVLAFPTGISLARGVFPFLCHHSKGTPMSNDEACLSCQHPELPPPSHSEHSPVLPVPPPQLNHLQVWQRGCLCQP